VSLAALQSALASVFTDPEARARFAADPEAFAAHLGLPDVGRAQLRALGTAAVSSYASTLARKRRSEAAGFLPRTRAALGETFATTFESWALRTMQAPGPTRNRSDASRYCDWLWNSQEGCAESVREALAWDRHELRATARPVYLGFARLSGSESNTYGAWLKFGRTWHWQLASKRRQAGGSLARSAAALGDRGLVTGDTPVADGTGKRPGPR
jgi:hypothetical protein